MVQPSRSYVLACTPRVGSHLLSDALASTGIAGRPREWLPRFTRDTAPRTASDRMKLVTQAPAVAPDAAADAEHIARVLQAGTSENGVFGIVIHWPVLPDAVRRLHAFLGTGDPEPHRVLSSAFPGLSYVWVRRRDRVAQAVSWYKAIQTGTYVGPAGPSAAVEGELRFDYGKIRYLVAALTSFENAWSSFFASSGVTPLVVHYEDLSANYVSTIRSVMDFLQLDAENADIARPRHEKYADALSLSWIEQFKLLQGQARSAR